MSLAQVEAVTESAQVEEEGGSLGREAWRQLRRDPAALIGFGLIAFFVLVAVFAPWIAPYDPRTSPARQVTPPSSRDRPLSTGSDSTSSVATSSAGSCSVPGSRCSSVWWRCCSACSAASPCGLLAGAFGGWVDAVTMRLVDIMLSIPGLLAAIGIAALLGPSLRSVMIAIAVTNVPIFARLLRGQMLGQRGSDYVLAATSLGIRRRAIVLRHVVPNSMSPVIVQATLTLATAIIEAAGLSFLGLGSPDPGVPEWGRMLADTQRFLASAPHLAFFPGVAIVIAALGFTLLGERLREALDPKYRR